MASSMQKINTEKRMKVFIKVRNPTKQEESEENKVYIIEEPGSDTPCLQLDKHKFYFEKLFTKNAIFELHTVNMFTSSLKNKFNLGILAYGARKSGKTSTLFGPHPNIKYPYEVSKGLIQIAGEAVFRHLKKTENLDCSAFALFYVVIDDEVLDILCDDRLKPPLIVYDHPMNGMNVDHLSRTHVKTIEEIISLYTKGISKLNERLEMVGKKDYKCHKIFSIVVDRILPVGRNQHESTILLADLAAFDDLNETNDSSLVTLKRVLEDLAQGVDDRTISYGDSRLTKLLKKNLGGKAVTLFIGTIPPTTSQLNLSLHTLELAKTAQNVEMQPCGSYIRTSMPMWTGQGTADFRINVLRTTFSTPGISTDILREHIMTEMKGNRDRYTDFIAQEKEYITKGLVFEKECLKTIPQIEQVEKDIEVINGKIKSYQSSINSVDEIIENEIKLFEDLKDAYTIQTNKDNFDLSEAETDLEIMFTIKNGIEYMLGMIENNTLPFNGMKEDELNLPSKVFEGVLQIIVNAYREEQEYTEVPERVQTLNLDFIVQNSLSISDLALKFKKFFGKTNKVINAGYLRYISIFKNELSLLTELRNDALYKVDMMLNMGKAEKLADMLVDVNQFMDTGNSFYIRTAANNLKKMLNEFVTKASLLNKISNFFHRIKKHNISDFNKILESFVSQDTQTTEELNSMAILLKCYADLTESFNSSVEDVLENYGDHYLNIEPMVQNFKIKIGQIRIAVKELKFQNGPCVCEATKNIFKVTDSQMGLLNCLYNTKRKSDTDQLKLVVTEYTTEDEEEEEEE